MSLPEDEWKRLESLRDHPGDLTKEELIRVLIILIRRSDFVGGMTFEEQNVLALTNLLKLFATPEYECWRDTFQARLFANKGEVEEAIFLYRKVLFRKEANLESVKMYTYFFLAAVYNQYGANNQAIETYQACLKLAKDVGNTYIQGYIFSKLAYSYTTNGQFKEALELCRDAIRISQVENGAAAPVVLRIQECAILLEIGNLEEAQQRIYPLYDEIIETKNTSDVSVAEATLGKLFYLKKDYYTARNHLERAIEINRKRGRPVLLANNLLLLVELLAQMGSCEEAGKLLDEAKKICEKVPNAYLVTSCFEMTVALRSAEGKYDEALSAFREFYDAKQKLLSQESERRMELVRVEHQVQQKEREAELYRVKSEQLEKELMNKTTYLISQSEILSRLKGDLKAIVNESFDPVQGIKRVRDTIKDIQTETIDWEEYDKTFSSVHPEFKQHLLERYPELTPMETKVCTLLRIELSSKEIAKLLNISQRSVENHRYRARKKVGLGDHENFQQLLTSL